MVRLAGAAGVEFEVADAEEGGGDARGDGAALGAVPVEDRARGVGGVAEEGEEVLVVVEQQGRR